MKDVLTNEDITAGDIAKDDINNYISKKARKHRRKKYDVVYICRNGKYKKFKIPHEDPHENSEDDPILAGVVERDTETSAPKTQKEKDVMIQLETRRIMQLNGYSLAEDKWHSAPTLHPNVKIQITEKVDIAA